ncbi:hypothetical protein [Clostridium tertium]|uniref:FtsX-like permease family protein n=1 Tax=Clostridium tertium TaxID=1559 RepID=A0A6N3H072_9CLOT
MKRNNKSIFIISMLSTISIFVITFILSNIITSLKLGPFELKSNYYILNVNTYEIDFNVEEEKGSLLINQLYNLFMNYENLLVIKEPLTYEKLYIYDPLTYFKDFEMEGDYFSKDDFFDKENNNILIYNQSDYLSLMKNNKIYIKDEYKNVIGKYTLNNPLKRSQRGYYLIETFQRDTDAKGNYYIKNADESLIKEMINIFKNEGYSVSSFNSNETSNVSFKNLINRKETFLMLPTLLIILFAEFITFSLISIKNRDLINIHYLFGGREKNIFIFMIKEAKESFILGSFVGGLLGVIILKLIYGNVDLISLLISVITNLILEILIMFISFKRSKYKIVKEDLI